MNLAILGSTGSIGKSAVSVAKGLDNINVVGLTANNRARSLLEQALDTSADIAVIASGESYKKNKELFSENSLAKDITLYSGREGIEKLITDKRVDVVVNGLSGFAGLKPTLTALKAGKKVAIANKEAIVMGWPLIKEEIQYAGQLMPVDSEHSAVFQLLNGEDIEDVAKIILTASGGAVYNRTDLENITPRECLAHPNWDMGVKITVDSATLMNKGLELIEAHNLFGIAYEKMEVYIHPQSLVHALIHYVDGTLTAHLSPPDMRLPIQYALTAPGRQPAAGKSLSVEDIKELRFSEPDKERFPALDTALEAAKEGIAALVALCAADEAVIKAFMSGKIKFTRISSAVKEAVKEFKENSAGTLEEIEELYFGIIEELSGRLGV
ncbi:MAG: 1-deoxy-D-xylulose-5-phosphate reductoisomerase [Elusimicrobiota bacterium]|nr:1-deoxy-D-xylulose-5-phosphate reductoisomerase [Elusimicrobiota bacterium]